MDLNYVDEELQNRLNDEANSFENFLLAVEHLEATWNRTALPYTPSWEDVIREALRRLLCRGGRPVPPPRTYRTAIQLRVLQDNYTLALLVIFFETLIIILLLF